MNSFFHNAFVFFKRYFFIVFLSVLIGNLIAWKNGSEGEQFYEYVVKVRSRVDYYDLVRTHFEKIASEFLAAGDSKLMHVPIESYRNENFYFIEMKLQVADTALAAGLIARVTNRIKTDADLREKYFDPHEYYSMLIAEDKEIIKMIEEGEVSMKDPGFRKSLFELKYYLSSLLSSKIELEEKIQIYFPSSVEYKYIETGNSFKTYLSASVLFFIIGLFIAAVADRFRT